MNDSDPSAASPDVPRPAASSEGKGREAGLTIARNSLWMMVDSLAAIVASFYCSIAVARNLGPDVMGQFNFILYFATVLKMFTEVAIPATVRKFAAEFIGREDYVMLRTVISAALRLQTKLAGAGAAVGLVIVFSTFHVDHRVVATLAVLSIFPSLLLSIPSGALWATGDLRHIVLSSLAGALVNVTGVTASLLGGWGLVGLTASLLLSRFVDCAMRFLFFRLQYARLPGEARPGPLDSALRARMIRFAAHQAVLGLIYGLLFDRMEVFFLKSLAPTREIAFFSISFTVVLYLLQIPMNLAGSASVNVWVQQGRAPEQAARTTATATWFVMLLAAPMLFGMAAVSAPLLHLLYGARYAPAIPVLTVLAPFGLAFAASQPAQYLLVAAERQRFYIAWLGLAGLIDVLGCVLLIPAHGALGAAFAKGAAEVIGAVGFLAYLLVRFKVKLPLWRMAKLLAVCIAMSGLVRLTGAWLPSLLALLVGIPLGAAIFGVLTRWLRCLDSADRDRLRKLDRLIPMRARGSYLAMVDFLAHA